MTGKERVYRTLDYRQPDRIPVDVWTLPIAHKKLGRELDALIDSRNVDIVQAVFFDPTKDLKQYDLGIHLDVWGCEWHNHQEGITGETKAWPLANLEACEMNTYQSPTALLLSHRDEVVRSAESFIQAHGDKFVLCGWGGLFERMQYIRGVENLLCDIALESEEFFKVRDIVFEYTMAYFDIVSSVEGADACILADDWGSQRALLISPEAWRKLFKPFYWQIIKRIKSNGKRVFVHSDGNILSIYEDWIEMGVSAINSQVWCMGVPQVAEATKGRITLWGELDRQYALPQGSTQDVQRMIDEMKQYLWQDGGLIGQFEVNCDIPFSNIRAGLFGW